VSGDKGGALGRKICGRDFIGLLLRLHHLLELLILGFPVLRITTNVATKYKRGSFQLHQNTLFEVEHESPPY